MKCPACYNELVEIQFGGLLLDVCQGGCGGIWFDAFELQRVERELSSGQLLQIQRDEAVQVDPARKRECPRCSGIKLLRHYFSAKRRVQVDHCPNCAGYWLDAGELALIQAERAESAAAERSSASVVISSEFIRYVYRLKSESEKRT